jgi:chemotaxis protein MotB
MKKGEVPHSSPSVLEPRTPEMAGKGGGGAWKVAYADFVTAMMAFFLVMWICGQDQKVRQAVSYYFNDPTNTSMVGTSKRPSRSGSVADMTDFGNVPKSESVALGRGRQSHSRKRERALATKRVSEWLLTDDKSRDYWENQAQQAREWASSAKEVREKKVSADEAAALRLATTLNDELVQQMAGGAKGLQQDLLYEILGQVNWFEVAEDVLTR